MSKNTASHNCVTCPSRYKTEWCNLGDSEFKLMERGKHTRHHDTGEVLFHQGDASNGVYCVREGLVGSRYIGAEGNSALLRLSEMGTTIGYRSYLTKQTHLSSVEVLSPSNICFIHDSVLSRWLFRAVLVERKEA